jgi:cyclophilin family peptidyl-prolyl cis-trans isomerase
MAFTSWLQGLKRNLGRRHARIPVLSGRRHSYRPRVEGLEERCLLTVAINAIPNQSVPQGKTLIVPVTGTDSAGDPLTYTVTSSASSQVDAQVLNGNTFVKISVSIGGTPTGDMVFELFNDFTPNTVSQITALINKGFYNGLTFHRVIPNFVIQGGDPNGNGTGGPGFTFDDEYNADLIFSGDGQLAMANSGPDTNGSQFFVTIHPQRGLDFDQTIFGQLVEGFNVRDAIAAVPIDPTTNKPLTPVVMSSVSIIQDTTDAVLLLSASPSAASAMITVTATATDGMDTKTFSATGFPDTTDDPPFLNPVANQTTNANAPVTFNVSATNIQKDLLTFEAIPQGSPANATATVGGTVTSNGTTVTVTPNFNFVGTVHVLVGVEETGATTRGNGTEFIFDTHMITVNVTNVGVVDAPISAAGTTVFGEFGQTLNATFATFADSDATLTAGDFSANINWGDGTSSAGTVTQVAAGHYAVAGAHNFGSLQPSLLVTVSIVHTDPPSGVTASTATVTTDLLLGDPTTTYVRKLYQDLLHRQADPGGLSGWVNLLNQGVNRTQVALDFESSIENRTLEVEGLYAQVLDRAADAGGLQSWVNFLVQGGTLDHAEAFFIASPEYLARLANGPQDNNNFVTDVYQTVLNRAPDPGGLQAWSQALANGASHAAIALDIIQSQESAQDQVEALYATYLHRAADSSGLTAFTTLLLSGAPPELATAIIVGSAEYFTNL